jgi:hypothetical protein
VRSRAVLCRVLAGALGMALSASIAGPTVRRAAGAELTGGVAGWVYYGYWQPNAYGAAGGPTAFPPGGLAPPGGAPAPGPLVCAATYSWRSNVVLQDSSRPSNVGALILPRLGPRPLSPSQATPQEVPAEDDEP